MLLRRVFTEGSRVEPLGTIRKRQRTLSPASSICSNTPTEACSWLHLMPLEGSLANFTKRHLTRAVTCDLGLDRGPSCTASGIGHVLS
ncbi:hypothetical protein HPB50_009462 [Hyalomma asiaticum]|uniref:Uncharacterized protein n=1 Tax=Hyalomma asiaticum TaxID=266040 RepID=A0ACB7S5F1_HYAAI|nr:hypothetical protein HPB50_009462 [Hyalomma asiaticum]